MKVFAVTVALAAGIVAGGCGGEEVKPIPAANPPSVTAPGTTIPYEDGGADGSGSDGRKEREDRGGVAGGPDIGTGS